MGKTLTFKFKFTNERVERSASQLFGHVGVSHIRCELEMCRKADVITEEPEFQSGMVKA